MLTLTLLLRSSMSAPAIPIDPSIISSLAQPDSSAATAASLQDDSALADDSDDDDLPAVVSAVPRRFSRRQSRGATGTEVRRLSNARRDGGIDSASWTPRSGSFTGDAEARQRKWSSGVDSLRPMNAFHIDKPVLAGGHESGGGGDLADKSALASASTTTLRKASQSQHDLGTTPTLLRRPSHSNGAATDGRSSVAELGIQEPPASDTPGRDTGSLKQLRAKLVLGTICVAQLLDNVSMTSVNMALPAIAEELNISQADQAWLISSYTYVSCRRLVGPPTSDKWTRSRTTGLPLARSSFSPAFSPTVTAKSCCAYQLHSLTEHVTLSASDNLSRLLLPASSAVRFACLTAPPRFRLLTLGHLA